MTLEQQAAISRAQEAEEIKNEISDIKTSSLLAMLEATCAMINGQPIPAAVKASVRASGERLHSLRVWQAVFNGDDLPDRPGYLDPVP
jgi:hypothetical protein